MKQNLSLKGLMTEAQQPAVQDSIVELPDQLNFNSYQTSHFHMCAKARNLFKKLTDLDEGRSELIAVVTKAVKDSDKLFKMEADIIEKDKVTPAKFKSFVNLAFNIQHQLGVIEAKSGRSLGTNAMFPSAHVEAIAQLRVEQEEGIAKVQVLPSWMM